MCTQVQVCRYVNPYSPCAYAPWGSLASGPAAAAGIPLCPAPGHSTCLPCHRACSVSPGHHTCPVSLQAAAPRGCTVPASQCSCTWRASPSSRRSQQTMWRTASSRVSLAGTHTRDHRGGDSCGVLVCCSQAGLLQTVSAVAPSWRQSPRAERLGPAHQRAAPRRHWAGSC